MSGGGRGWRTFDPPPWFLAVLLAALGWVYLHGLASQPLKWMERRRAMVAMEMIHRADYVVPHLNGEPYLNKPPVHNWLIVLFAGNSLERVGPLSVRLVSLLALIGTAVLLWRLGTAADRGPVPLLAPVALVTCGMTVQFGAVGETDMPFTFLVVAALAAFEIGRRQGRPWLQWTVSQGLIGAGVLTKGLSPVFFYPPVLWLAWRRPAEFRFSRRAFAAGVLLLLAVVAAWIVPYSASRPPSALVDSFVAESSVYTVEQGLAMWATHLLAYPLMLLGAAAPWSLILLAGPAWSWRRARAAGRAEAWLSLSAGVVLAGVTVFAFVPGAKAHYLLPVLPPACVLLAHLLVASHEDPSRRRPPAAAWAVLAVALAALWVAYMIRGGTEVLGRPAVGPPLWLGLAFCAAVAAVWRTRRVAPAVLCLLLLGVSYGIAYDTVVEVREAERGERYGEAARELAASFDDTAPVVVHDTVDGKLLYELSRITGRPAVRRPPATGAFYWVGPGEMDGPDGVAGARQAARAWRYAAWHVPAGTPRPTELRRPDTELARQLDDARRISEARPDDPAALVRVARIIAHAGRHEAAEALLARGLAQHPGDPRLLRHRGQVRLALGRTAEAEADLERAAERLDGWPDEVEAPPLTPRPREAQSGTLRRLDAWLDELREGGVDARGSRCPTLHWSVHATLGLARLLRGDRAAAAQEALARARDAVAEPDCEARAGLWLALALGQQGRHDEARRAASALSGTGEPQAAARAYLDPGAVETTERRPLVLYAAASRRLEEGRTDAAGELLRRAITAGSPDDLAVIAATVALDRLGRLDRSRAPV